ncbi:hypothetical protein GCM10010508_41460 [Streptomyces naganishii JCM 4654]|uniref:Integrase n=1 Tax=Streptomyces naganishii JCM 4654 TaxID=1306179 RepID=A0A918Y6M9_9ACTN|nr:hypothetical protein GCM10010508_41460 [Streptomyces naganishii JCM 4654]
MMEILGHSRISITMDVYPHVVRNTQREATSHMDRSLKRRLPEPGTVVCETGRLSIGAVKPARTMIGPGRLAWCPRQDSNLRHPL